MFSEPRLDVRLAHFASLVEPNEPVSAVARPQSGYYAAEFAHDFGVDRNDLGHAQVARKKPELEANEFAADLLMPEKLILGRFGLRDISLATVSSVANEFETGLTAAAIRILELTDVPSAIAWSEGNQLIWYRTSSTFPFYLPKAELPAKGSKAGQLFDRKRITPGPSKVQTNLWLQDADARAIPFIEEDSRYLPNYEAVLTLLVCKPS